jgi:hypothetical protein
MEEWVATASAARREPPMSAGQRRVILDRLAGNLSRRWRAGEVTSLDALVSVARRAAEFDVDGRAFVNDIGATLSRTTTANVLTPSGSIPEFKDDGFREGYRDGSNQVRHFAASLVLGAWADLRIGIAGNALRELISIGSGGTWPDVTMGTRAVTLGNLLANGSILPEEVPGVIEGAFGQ